MQSPIIIGLHRSFFLDLGLCVVHGLAATLVLATDWEAWVVTGILCGITASWGISWCRVKPQVAGLQLQGDGRMECRLASGGSFLSAEVLPGATVHPWLTVVRLKLPKGRAAVVVLPDSTTREEFRRLRVWLRWRAKFIGPKSAA